MSSRCITIGKYNVLSQGIDVLVDTKESQVKYDLLDLSYRIELKVYWFSNAWRRRNSECITVCEANPAIYIEEGEINKLRYIEKKLKENSNIVTDEDKSNFVVNLLNNDNKLFIALIEKYSSLCIDGLGENCYISCRERFSSYEMLYDNFRLSYFNDIDFLDDHNLIYNCIYDEY